MPIFKEKNNRDRSLLTRRLIGMPKQNRAIGINRGIIMPYLIVKAKVVGKEKDFEAIYIESTKTCRSSREKVSSQSNSNTIVAFRGTI